MFLDALFIALVIFVGHWLCRFYSERYKDLQKKQLHFLFYYHLAFSILYFIYISIYGGDSVGYWKFPFRFGFREGDSVFDLHDPGSEFVHFLVYPLAQTLGLHLFTGCIIFSLFGFVGFIYLNLTINRTVGFDVRLYGVRLLPYVLFLPNMHFWSSAVGKDAVIFFALNLYVFSLIDPKSNLLGLLISFYFAYFLRPHIALLMVIGLAFGLLTSSRGLNMGWRIALLGVSIYLLVIIAPSVFEFIGIEENLDSIEDISDIRAKNLSRGSVASAIDISSYNTAQKMLTFFFRPLFLDGGNIFGIFVSFENLFYLILTIAIFKWRNLAEIPKLPAYLKASLLIMFAAAYFMSSSLSNLGIIIRQKNMVMFMFLLLALFLIKRQQRFNKVLKR